MTYKQVIKPDIKEPNGKDKNYVEGNKRKKEDGKEGGQTIINNFSYLEGRRTKIS